MDFLISLDHALFAKINLDWTNAFFDWFFPRITDLQKNPLTLLVLLPLLVFWYMRRGPTALRWILITIVSVGLSDLAAYRGLKNLVERDRPEAAHVVLALRTDSHTGPSFPSNHASNMFAAATALSGGLPHLAPIFYSMAALVAYSRVYCGVHFPLDVISGAILGTLIALLVRAVFRWRARPRSDLNGDLGDAIVRSAEGSSRGRNLNRSS